MSLQSLSSTISRGRVPDNSLSLRDNEFNLVNLPTSEGIFPLRTFSARSICSRFVSKPISVDILPLTPFLLRKIEDTDLLLSQCTPSHEHSCLSSSIYALRSSSRNKDRTAFLCGLLHTISLPRPLNEYSLTFSTSYSSRQVIIISHAANACTADLHLIADRLELQIANIVRHTCLGDTLARLI